MSVILGSCNEIREDSLPLFQPEFPSGTFFYVTTLFSYQFRYEMKKGRTAFPFFSQSFPLVLFILEVRLDLM